MKIIENNKRAYFEYFIDETFEAGIVLEGSEIKSIRGGGISLKESFCRFEKGELFLKNCHVAPYNKKTGFDMADPRRDRKLLLSKAELRKLAAKTALKGFTIIATKAYFKGNYLKIEIGLARGKKLFDKRNDIKEKDVKRDMDRLGKY